MDGGKMAKWKGPTTSNTGLRDLIQMINRIICGEVFWVKKSTDADFKAFVNQRRAGTVFQTIQAALNACTAGQGDIVMVAPGSYTENLTMSKADVTLMGMGASPYSTVIDGNGAITITITGVDVRIENLHIQTSGAAIVCVYGTGLVGGPAIINCDFTQLTLTSLACIQIAGATSRGCRVVGCNFLGASATADAVNIAGKQHHVIDNTSEDLNTTEATCFGVTSYHTGSSNLAV